MALKETGSFRIGNTFKIGEEIFRILKMEIQNNGRSGGANVKWKLKNLDTGSIVETTYKSTDRVDHLILDRKKMQYLYENAGNYTFMDNETYEQVEITTDDMGDTLKYLKEGMSVEVTMYGSRHIGIELEDKVELTIEYTEPAVRGDTSGKVMKPATLETGAEIMVPAFIEIGELVRVDTRDGSFVERVK